MALQPNFRGRLPRPGGATSSITRDPAAEAYYSNDPAMVASAVRQGYARGGPVDPMGYQPDPLPERKEQKNEYDPYNTIGREEPKVSPVMAYAPDTGYARGGSVGYADGGDVGAYDSARAAWYSARDKSDPWEQEKAAFGNAARGMPAYAAGGEVKIPRPGYDDDGMVYDPGDFSGVSKVDGQETPAYTKFVGDQNKSYAQQLTEGREDKERQRAYESERLAREKELTAAQEATARHQQTGYTQPAPRQSQSTLGNVMDYIHGMFSVGEAGAAENPQLPQQTATSKYGPSPITGGSGTTDIIPGAPRAVPTEPRRPTTGYGTEDDTLPTARGTGTTDVVPSVPMTATPSISGRDTSRVAEIPAGSKLAQLDAAEAADRAKRPVGERSTWELIKDVAHAGIPEQDRVQAERELYQGTDANLALTDIPGRLWQGMRSGLEGLVRGDHPRTPAETLKVLDTISQNPQADHNPMVQQTFNELGKTGGVDAQANFVQSLRPSYNKYMGIGQAALSQGRVDMAMKFFEQAHNLLPNERKLTFQLDPKGGGIIATVQPEGPGGGQPMAVRMTAAQLYDYGTGPASQFDVVAKNGIEKNLQKLATSGGVQAPPPLEPGQIRPSGPGGAVLSGPGGVPRPGSSDYRGEAGAAPGPTLFDRQGGIGGVPYGPGGNRSDVDVRTGNFTRRDAPQEVAASRVGQAYDEKTGRSYPYIMPNTQGSVGQSRPRYDVERNIGESEPATMTDRRAGEGVQGIIANTRKTAAAAAQNQTPEGEVLDPTAPARSLTAQDPRSVAARNQFAQRVTAPRPQVAPPIQGEAPRPAPAAPAAQPTAPKPATPAEPVKIASPEQLAQLPVGQRYIAPDGTERVKQ